MYIIETCESINVGHCAFSGIFHFADHSIHSSSAIGEDDLNKILTGTDHLDRLFIPCNCSK
jgi:hypothetical protein